MSPANRETATYTPDKLIAGHLRLLSKKATLITPQNCVRGTVMGKATVGAIASAAFAGNTGDGAMGAVTAGAGCKIGVYKVVIIEPAANAGKFAVEDPDGVIVGTGTVAVAFAGPVNFTLADGAADFIAGDGFNLTVAAGSGKYLKAVAAAADGSNIPDAILVEDRDATAADKECLLYTSGDFNEDALTLGAGLTLDGIREVLRTKGIHLVKPQAN